MIRQMSDEAIVMRITSKKPARFYIRAAATFFRGTMEKPPVAELQICALGNTIPAAVEVADAMQRQELGTIVQVSTSYGDATSSSTPTGPSVTILMKKCGARKPAKTEYEAVGGHEDSIIFEGPVVWKQMQSGSRGEMEGDFFKKAMDVEVLRDFVPTFHGFREISGDRYMGMANLLDGFEEPAVVDLKMGTRTVGSDASPAKVAAAEKKNSESTTSTLGVRVVGGKYRLVKDGDWLRVGYKSKEEGTKKITNESELAEFLGSFLCSPSLRTQLAAKIECLSSWFTKQTEFAFYSSSLLIAYDTEELPAPKELRLSMIDFAHVEAPPAGGDKSYLVGLETLQRTLNGLKS